MKTRLGIFVICLLLLPMAGHRLSGNADWLTETPAETLSLPIYFSIDFSGQFMAHFTATLLTSFALLAYILFANHLTRLRIGSSPLNVQGRYFLVMGIAGAVLGWLLVYLNYFAASWRSESGDPVRSVLISTPLFALLAPAVLSTRALLGSFTGLLKLLARGFNLPSLGGETRVYALMSLAILGLMGGAAWPAQLFWLMWLSPLLLLVGLQLLWHEGTIFPCLNHGDLKSGNWGRVVCVALAGIITGNFAMIIFQASGGNVAINLPYPWLVNHALAQLGYAVFGLLCQQLGDVVAEHWRGVRRENFPPRKKFPINVVVKKS